VLEYFNDLHARAARMTNAFHDTFKSLVVEFGRVKKADELSLSMDDFPFTLNRRNVPEAKPGPMKTWDRAKAKYEGWVDGNNVPGKIAWPPLAAELLDLIRTTVLFDDPFDLAAFLHFMKLKFKLVRVANRFENFDPEKPGCFRNVNTNILFYDASTRESVVVEVQLHLRAVKMAAEMIHCVYEVVRASSVAEVVGPPYKFDDKSDYTGALALNQPTCQEV